MFLAAAGTTAVLSLDATIVLLTPVVFSTAARLRFSPRPHVYACTHLANSASLLLPVSNLTNLLAFNASGLSFARFGGADGAAVAGGDRDRVGGAGARVPAASWAVPRHPRTAEPPTDPPVFALAVLGLTLGGRSWSSSRCGRRWPARWSSPCAGGRRRASSPAPPSRASSCSCSALGVVVAAASDHGLRDAVDSLIPHGAGLPALIAIAVLAAVVANLVNNLPATLIMLPAVAAGGAGPVLAMLVGVNVGPNLSYVGSLATLLWRRVMHAHDEPTDIRAFTRARAEHRARDPGGGDRRACGWLCRSSDARGRVDHREPVGGLRRRRPGREPTSRSCTSRRATSRR